MRNPEKETELSRLKNITMLPLDVTNTALVKETVTKAISLYNIDVVLNNEGYGLIGPLEALSDEQINLQINTNLLGVINVAKSFTPYFREKKDGMFINVTSTFGLLSLPTCSVYSASKFAVDGFSEGLAYELAQFNIKVKIVAPGGKQNDFAGRSLQGGTHKAYQHLINKVSEGYSAAKYHEVEVQHHGTEWIVEEDALAFLTDADLVGRNIMSQQERWPKTNSAIELEHKIGENIWWLIVLAERSGIDIKAALDTFLTKTENLINS